MMISRSLVSSAAIAALTSTLSLSSVARAEVGDLYAVTGAGGGAHSCAGTLSSLYELNPVDGSASLIGPVMLGSTQLRHINGLAMHPSTGVLYAVMNGQEESACSFSSTLLTIDPATAEATIVGSQNSLAGPIPDITFDPFGNLYGWTEDQDELIAINIADGTQSQIGNSDLDTYATGIASDSQGRMFLKIDNYLYKMNPFTAAHFDEEQMDRNAHNMLAFDTGDVLFGGERTPDGFDLFTIDVQFGDTMLRGANSVMNISAIEFDRGVVTPPPVSDLSLTKDVDDDTTIVGEDVVFTLVLTNDGPDAADNVVVTDVLPANLTYVSHTGDGDYNDFTGAWSLASVPANDSATIEITANGTAAFEYNNVAEVTATDSYDPDSVPGSEDSSGDTFASANGEVAVPQLFSISADDNYLWAVDEPYGPTDFAQRIFMANEFICGSEGLTTQPDTDTMWAVLRTDDCSTRTLATLGTQSAEATQIGDFGETVIGPIAFDDTNTLYAVSDSAGDDPDKLFTVGLFNANLTQVCSVEDSTGNRTLAFADGRLFYATYECDNFCQLVFHVIDPASFPADPEDPCPETTIETGYGIDPTGLTLDEVGVDDISLLVSSYSSLYRATIPNDLSTADIPQLGWLSDFSNGLTYVDTVVTKGNLTTSKSAAKSRVKGDKFIEYTLQATNTGPDPLTGELTDQIPFGTTLVSTGQDCELVGNEVKCSVQSLDVNQTRHYFFTVQVTCKKCSSIINTVLIDSTQQAYEYPYDNGWNILTQVKGKF